MNLSNRQLEEIEFLEKSFMDGNTSTDLERKEYFDWSERGIGSNVSSTNRLAIAKSRLNITAAMWKEDLVVGILGIEELYNDPELKSPYFYRFLKRLLEGITKEYRMEKLAKFNGGTVLAITNFPEITKSFKRLFNA